MRKFLMITTALVCFGATPLDAAPVVALVANGVGLWTAVGAVYGTAAAIIGQLTLSLVLSRVSMALAGKPKQADVIRELQQPNSLPPYRFVYGDCWAPGSPAPVRVKGKILYACYILNSRPSVGPFTVYLDKRLVAATGDAHDFAGPGAAASNAPFTGHCRYWIGRGDQVAPPAQVLTEAPEFFQATDGWQGRTVIWLRLDVGGNDSRSERWPATPPEVMVSGKWSRVWDPRDPAQDADDPATWTWSANQALCTLDALRQNPLRPYGDTYLWRESFIWAADVADQPFAVKGGGSIPRFKVNGVLAFAQGSELEDQVQPLADAGAARFIRVGGRLGLVPAIYVPPVMALSDVIDDTPLSFTRYRPSSDLVTAVCATYTSPERYYEDATTPTHTIPGAQAEDGGIEKLGQYELRFVTDHRQGQYVAAIMGRRTRCQRTLSGVFPPVAFDLVGGSTVTMALPAPYTGRNGIYEVEEAHPGLDPVGRDGVAMRVALTLRETGPWVYAWDPATDELDVVIEDFDPTIGAVQPSGAVTATSGAGTVLVSGDSMTARVLFAFDPSPSPSVISYEWQFAADPSVGAPRWQSGGLIDADIRSALGDVFGYLLPAVVGQDYRIRVRAVAIGGASDWVESNTVAGSAGSFLAPAPAPVSAAGGGGEIAVTFRAPNNGAYRALEIWAAGLNDSGAAALMAGPVFGAANATVTEIEDGLGANVTRFYFARSIDRNGAPSPFSAAISATTTTTPDI